MYQGLLAFHIISFITWMAVLFYLPRLYVYHAENRENAGFLEVIKVMERKLYYYIGIPGFWMTIISGTALILQNPAMLTSGGWLHAKVSMVILLAGYFFHLGLLRKTLESDECDKSGKFFRMYNEVPTILMIVIVILVIFKPF